MNANVSSTTGVITANAGRNVTLNAGSISTTGGVSLTATAGDIDEAGAGTITSGTLSAIADTSVTLNNANSSTGIDGSTGTGKSVCLNTIILSILMTRRPDEVKMIMLDPKGGVVADVQGVGARARLGVAVDDDRVPDDGQAGRRLDRMDAGAGDVEVTGLGEIGSVADNAFWDLLFQGGDFGLEVGLSGEALNGDGDQAAFDGVIAVGGAAFGLLRGFADAASDGFFDVGFGDNGAGGGAGRQ